MLKNILKNTFFQFPEARQFGLMDMNRPLRIGTIVLPCHKKKELSYLKGYLSTT
jgi:hypothetical protein